MLHLVALCQSKLPIRNFGVKSVGGSSPSVLKRNYDLTWYISRVGRVFTHSVHAWRRFWPRAFSLQLASYASGCVLCGKLGPDYVTISDCYVQEGGCPPPQRTLTLCRIFWLQRTGQLVLVNYLTKKESLLFLSQEKIPRLSRRQIEEWGAVFGSFSWAH